MSTAEQIPEAVEGQPVTGRRTRGGADAAVVREFDIVSKSFVKGGFELPEAKSNILSA